jgi:hypothetical protein
MSPDERAGSLEKTTPVKRASESQYPTEMVLSPMVADSCVKLRGGTLIYTVTQRTVTSKRSSL